jgi:hypothetical protein
MLTSLLRKLVTAIALLLLFASSSAYGAQALRRETKRAFHHHATRRHATRRHHAGRSGPRSSGRSATAHSPAALTATIAPSSALLLGDEAVEPGRDSLSAGEAEAFPFRAVTSGLTGAVHVYIDYRNAAQTLIVGLYANAGGHPGALLTSGSTSSLKAHEWNTASVAPVPLASGSTYWLTVLGSGGTLRYRDRANGPCDAQTSAQTDLGALPSAWSTGEIYSTCPISAYLTGSHLVLDPPPPPKDEQPNTEPPAEEQPKTEPPVKEKQKTEPPVVEQPKTEPPVKEQPKTEPPVEEQPKTTPPVEENPSGKTNCINVPSACGYPDATNTGAPAGAALTSKSGEVSVTKAGTTVKDLAVTGEIDIEANNTIVEDDEVTASAGSGNRGIYIAPGVTGTVIDHVTCHGAGKGTQYCIFNKDSSTKIEYSYLYNCGECLNGPGEITNSFFDVTAVISGEHYEDIYYGGGEGPLIVNHDTMLNPQGQTATVFASTDFGDQTTLTITNNLLAGGGYTLYGGTSCTTGGCGSVVGPVTVTGNRFSSKYYPDSGYYGVASYFDNALTTWSGNIWDANLKPVEE